MFMITGAGVAALVGDGTILGYGMEALVIHSMVDSDIRFMVDSDLIDSALDLVHVLDLIALVLDLDTHMPSLVPDLDFPTVDIMVFIIMVSVETDSTAELVLIVQEEDILQEPFQEQHCVADVPI